ncbi:MAG: hypothetical protein Q9171_000558 [Xanthocarpia ochracea]
MVSTVLISFLALNTLFPILHTSASPFPFPDVAISRPPKPPICPEDLGPRPPRTVGFSRDCERAIASIPRDMRPASPVRNFYLLTEHVDPTMPNVQLPFERESGMSLVPHVTALPVLLGAEEAYRRRDYPWGDLLARSYQKESVLGAPHLRLLEISAAVSKLFLTFRPLGDCVVQLLMASSMMNVPHDRATWMDIWGPSRLILQQCIGGGRKKGGIITNIGENEKLDLAIYSKRSLFAATRRLRDSPRATTNVAEVEFLQLLGLLPGPAGSIRASLNETLVPGESCAGEAGANKEATTA